MAAHLRRGCDALCDVLQEFESSFLELLRRAHPFSRVAAKNVYNDFIADKSVEAALARKCALLPQCAIAATHGLSALVMLSALHYRTQGCVNCDAGTTST